MPSCPRALSCRHGASTAGMQSLATATMSLATVMSEAWFQWKGVSAEPRGHQGLTSELERERQVALLRHVAMSCAYAPLSEPPPHRNASVSLLFLVSLSVTPPSQSLPSTHAHLYCCDRARLGGRGRPAGDKSPQLPPTGPASPQPWEGPSGGPLRLRGPKARLGTWG